MQHFVGDTFRSIDPVLYCVVLALLVVAYAAWRLGAGRRNPIGDRVYWPLLMTAGVAGSLGLLVTLGLAFQYLNVPGFIDHIEPQIASVGWQSCLGVPPHPNLYTAAQVTLPYGPLDLEGFGRRMLEGLREKQLAHLSDDEFAEWSRGFMEKILDPETHRWVDEFLEKHPFPALLQEIISAAGAAERSPSGRLELPAFDGAIGRLRGLGRGLASGLAALIYDL